MNAADALESIARTGVVGIVRESDPATALTRARAVIGAGLEVVEVSLTTPGALGVLEELAAEGHRAVLGAGTVLDPASARAVIAAGGRLLVCPTYSPAVVEVALAHDVLVLPGCLTPTEMVAAARQGALAVKIFPAHLWTPASLAGLLQALPWLDCVPTGGVSPRNAPDWIRAGATAVGVGAALTASLDPVAAVSDLRSAIDRARVQHA